MKLKVTIDDRAHEVELRTDALTPTAVVDNTTYRFDIHAAPTTGATQPSRTYLLTLGNRVYECHVARTNEGAMEIVVGTRVFKAHAADPRALPVGALASGGAAGRARVVAPMPGKIVRVLVEQGAQVEAGDGLLIVEAMKMQNEMRAPKNGTIAELHAETGATVQAGDVLVVIE